MSNYAWRVKILSALLFATSASAGSPRDIVQLRELKSGTVFKLRSVSPSKIAIGFNAGEKPKIVAVRELSASDLTPSQVSEWVSSCYEKGSNQYAGVSALVSSSIRYLNSAGVAPSLKIYTWNADIGKNEEATASKFFERLVSRMPVSWPHDGQVESDVESFVIDRECLKKKFVKIYTDSMLQSSRCEIFLNPKSFKSGDLLDSNELSTLAVGSVGLNSNEMFELKIKQPKTVDSLVCSKDIRSTIELDRFVDLNKSKLVTQTKNQSISSGSSPKVYNGSAKGTVTRTTLSITNGSGVEPAVRSEDGK